ncbi:MAG: response regulator [Ferruginibacter sp.]
MKKAHILLVEDNEGDIFLTKEALEESKITNKISVLKNGSDVMDFLKKTERFPYAQTPDLILLDLNLPKKNGLEVLLEIKESEAFKMIPVVMLTTSSSEEDIVESYKRKVNCFITKPVDAESFLKVILATENFWVQIVTLPKP